MFLYCVWQLVWLRLCSVSTCVRTGKAIVCVATACVCAAGEGRLVFALEDSVTSFIPVRIAGIICNLTTAGCQRAPK